MTREPNDDDLSDIARRIANTEDALDALFRARWELSDGDFDIATLDDELEALAIASGFDRAGAVDRWKAAQDAEVAAAHKAYGSADRHLGHSIDDAVQKMIATEEKPLVGRSVRELWKNWGSK